MRIPTIRSLGLSASSTRPLTFIFNGPKCHAASFLGQQSIPTQRSRAFRPRSSIQRRFAASLTDLEIQTNYDLSPRRSVIRLAGAHAAHFLDGLIPARILGNPTKQSSPIYTAFLTPQGRILADVFIYHTEHDGTDTWYIECDRDSVNMLMKHLKKHKLRSKFDLSIMKEEEYEIVYSTQKETFAMTDESVYAGGADPRPSVGDALEDGGFRWILKRDSDRAKVVLDSAAMEPEYRAARMTMGLAESSSEVISEHALPQESNVDLLGGIDFHKGCYLGQELTIRTHHTGVVRKRILPVLLHRPTDSASASSNADVESWPSDLTPPAGANISKVSTRKGRSTGKFLGSVGRLGLALCRLEMMTDIQLTGEATNYNPEDKFQVVWQDEKSGEEKHVLLTATVPDWVRQGVKASLERKDRRQPRQMAIGEEEDIAEEDSALQVAR